MSSIRVGIITVSDTAAADASADASGPVIAERIQRQGYKCAHTIIVPDDVEQIAQTVRVWSEQNSVDLIITTGGTGFGVRDKTPEAIAPLIERDAPGIVHLLLSASLKQTPMAALSRPVAGTTKNTLVVTLPGSVKAVKENLEALLSNGVIDHAVDLLKGGSGKQIHAAMGSARNSASEHVHHHQHHHHHHGNHDHKEPEPRTMISHDPSLPVSARHRESPYPIISLQQAIDTILDEVKVLEIVKKPVLSELMGHVLAENVHAPQAVPATQTTNVDGYALRSTDPPGVYQVVTSRSHAITDTIPQGCIYRVNTGGPLPAGADAVIMVEDTILVSTKDSDDGDLEEKQVKTLAQMPSGSNVRSPGSDVKMGELVLEKGEILTHLGGEIGTLTFVGRKEVEVYRKPVVAILSTGDELVDLHAPSVQKTNDGWGGIWDTNRPSLYSALEGSGYWVIDLGIVSDNVEAHRRAIQKGLEQADVVITTGGTSMGAGDLVKPVIERYFDGTIHFGRVAMKPGKPTTFASVPVKDAKNGKKYIFGLPGNPASALVTFYVFVVPALRKLGGYPISQRQLPRSRVELKNDMPLDPRTEFHRVVIRADASGLHATSTGGQRSSRVASLSGANGLVILPPLEKGGRTLLSAGEYADAVLIGELQMSN